MSPTPTQRTEPRRGVDLVASIETFGGWRSKRYRVRNLSTRGACLSGATKLRAGQTVVIAFGNLNPIAATIRWASDDRAGLQFAQAIDVDAAIGPLA